MIGSHQVLNTMLNEVNVKTYDCPDCSARYDCPHPTFHFKVIRYVFYLEFATSAHLFLP